MTNATITPPRFVYVADVLKHLGDIPAERVRLHPTPGSATIHDLERLTKDEGIFELIDGTLVSKTVGANESWLSMLIAAVLVPYVQHHSLGMVLGEAGNLRLGPDDVLSGDIAFTSWDRIPDRELPRESIPALVPNLVIEVLSRSNTAAEMRRKRVIYFDAGVDRVWEVDGELRTLTAYHTVDEYHIYARADSVPGEPMLPGFSLSLPEVFAAYRPQS